MGKLMETIELALNSAADGYLFPSRIITTSQTALTTDSVIIADATSGAITFTLRPAAEWENKIITIIRINGGINAVTIDGNASETINGAATMVLATQYEKASLISKNGAIYVI